MAGRRRLYTAVASLVRKLRKRSECIQHWTEYQPGEVTVMLIERGLQRICRPFVRRFGEGAGCGRLLVFRKTAGRWTLAGEGEWIS